MSIAFETNSNIDSNRIQSLGFRDTMWIHNLSESTRFTGANHWSNKLPAVKEEDDSTSSSSIGNNSDAAGVDSGDEDAGEEVQSKDNSPLSGLNDLEQSLPIKYNYYYQISVHYYIAALKLRYIVCDFTSISLIIS